MIRNASLTPWIIVIYIITQLREIENTYSANRWAVREKHVVGLRIWKRPSTFMMSILFHGSVCHRTPKCTSQTTASFFTICLCLSCRGEQQVLSFQTHSLNIVDLFDYWAGIIWKSKTKDDIILKTLVFLPIAYILFVAINTHIINLQTIRHMHA